MKKGWLVVLCVGLVGAAAVGGVFLQKAHDENKFDYPWDASLVTIKNQWSVTADDIIKEDKANITIDGDAYTVKAKGETVDASGNTVAAQTTFDLYNHTGSIGNYYDPIYYSFNLDKAAVDGSDFVFGLYANSKFQTTYVTNTIMKTNDWIQTKGNAIVKGNSYFGENLVDATKQNFMFRIHDGGTISAIHIYNLAGLGFSDQDKAVYVFDKLTAGKTLAAEMTFTKANISKYGAEYDSGKKTTTSTSSSTSKSTSTATSSAAA